MVHLYPILQFQPECVLKIKVILLQATYSWILLFLAFKLVCVFQMWNSIHSHLTWLLIGIDMKLLFSLYCFFFDNFNVPFLLSSCLLSSFAIYWFFLKRIHIDFLIFFESIRCSYFEVFKEVNTKYLIAKVVHIKLIQT